MRILHLLNHTQRLNGHVHAAVDLSCAQSNSGHMSAVASGGGDFDALLAKNNVEIFSVSHTRKALKLIKSSHVLHKIVKTWKPDLIHAHMMTSAVLAWPICQIMRVPLVTTVHNEFERSAILMGLGNRVIGVSRAVTVSMHKRGIPVRKLHTVLNGTIGSARFEYRTSDPLWLGSPAILSVGGQHPRKGLPDLFDAFDIVFRKFPDARLYIVGDGPFLDAYKTIISKMACASQVFFTGAQMDPYPWMLGADIFVLPSHSDPAPLVLSEAREAKCAIVATDVDGVPELLENGEAGILVPPRNPQALAEVLCSLVSDPEKLNLWKKKSQINIEYLDINRVFQDTMNVYRSI